MDEWWVEKQQLLAVLADRVRELAGSSAEIDLHEDDFWVHPVKPGALGMWIALDQWPVVEAGQVGGHWELDYENADEMRLVLQSRLVRSVAIAAEFEARDPHDSGPLSMVETAPVPTKTANATVVLAEEIIAAVILGRVNERFGIGRSLVTVELADGSTTCALGYRGLWAIFPQPRWTQRARRTQYLPYR